MQTKTKNTKGIKWQHYGKYVDLGFPQLPIAASADDAREIVDAHNLIVDSLLFQKHKLFAALRQLCDELQSAADDEGWNVQYMINEARVALKGETK